MTSRRISDDEIARRQSRFETLQTEYQICKRKLDSKCEALLILSKDLAQCVSERDQFKLMAEQLRERYQALKKQVLGKMPPSDPNDNNRYPHVKQQDLGFVLVETREQNKSLQFEVEDLRQKLHDAQGDIKLLREQIARQRVGTTDEGMNTRHFPAHERENLVQQLEASRDEYTQLERDLQQVIDEKEELVTERDVYKTKYERLNTELNYILKGDEKRVVDLDALIMENRYLQERLKQMEEEKSMAMATASKYKSLLERKKARTGMMKLSQSRGGGLVISHKQVSQVLGDNMGVPPTAQAMADLQALAGALLDTVNDKNMALSHQRKTNKILGNRVSELEKKIKTLEVAGLWNVTANMPSLERLKAECEEVKTLVPQCSEEIPDGDIALDLEATKQELADLKTSKQELADLEAEFCTPTSSADTSPTHSASSNPTLENDNAMSYLNTLDMSPTHRAGITPRTVHRAEIQDHHSQTIPLPDPHRSTMSDADYTYAMEDLDLLPIKEELVKCVNDEEDIHPVKDTCGVEVFSEDLEDENDSLALPDNKTSRPIEVDEETANHLSSLMENMTSKMVESSKQAKNKGHGRSENDAGDSDSEICIQSGADYSVSESQSSTPSCDDPLLSGSEQTIQDNPVDIEV
ncbi:coiled-coil domain-containing protein 149-like [Mizuhopecten yessoensis]|uniref:coiled-coil domain-containing protein 149-like n=1 Tax=Mizuhopecten yessoensis TaxID=6573 RepID=UPI000B4598FB|nr:coiled-coil domain-containing protein 149-like [Mizuhopecten yessoensis]